MILQKAYAKLYCTYETIIGGRVHYALSDLTGGFPEELKTKKYTQNPKPHKPLNVPPIS